MTAMVDCARYNELPSLEDAHRNQMAPGMDEIMNGPIREAFMKHGAHRDLCLYLQHAHHMLKSGEAIVKVEGTAHQMDQLDMDSVKAFGNDILPTTWMSTGDAVTPMEYTLAPKGETPPSPTAEFLNDFTAVLRANNCEKTFGIDTLAANDWAELSVGNASVVIPSAGQDFGQQSFAPVAFAFHDDHPGFIVHGKCDKKGGHRHTSKPVR